MNVGQILETHLGWAGKEIGRKVAELMSNGSKAEAVRGRRSRAVQGHAIHPRLGRAG